MSSNMHEGVKHAKFMRTSYTSLRSCFTQLLLHGHLKHGDRCRRANQPLFDKRAPVYPGDNRLLFKVDRSHTTVEVKTSNVINFIKHHVIHRFGVPRRIIHDNGPQFVSQVFYRFCDKYRIQNVASTTYNPAANGLAEAFNKIIIKLLKKFISSNKRDWNKKLSECLWAYRTTVRTPTSNTPFPWYTGLKQSYR